MPNLITIEQKILKKNTDTARENRERIDANGVVAVAFASSPGSGKTALLERVIAAIGGRARMAVIEGDVQTDRDAQRVQRIRTDDGIFYIAIGADTNRVNDNCVFKMMLVVNIASEFFQQGGI